MSNKEKKYEGFGNRTFDEWIETLTDEEVAYLESHLLVTFKFKDDSVLAVSMGNDHAEFTDKETDAAKAWESMEKCEVSVITDWFIGFTDWILGKGNVKRRKKDVQ